MTTTLNFFRAVCCALLAGAMFVPFHAAGQSPQADGGGDLERQMIRPDNPAADPDRWLTDDRWSELRYGLSIRQPKDATLLEQTRDGAQARWIMPDGTKISLVIHRGVHYVKDRRGQVTQEKIHLNTVVADVTATLEATGAGVSRMARFDVSNAGRVHNTRSDQWITVGKLIGWHNYFVIVPIGGNEPTIYGIGVLQLDDTSLLVLRVESPKESITQAVCTYESMLHSVQVEPPSEALKRIRGWVDNAHELLESIEPEQYQQALTGDTLYRITDSNRDIGFQRVWMRHQDKNYYENLEKQLARQNPDARIQGIDSFRLVGTALVIQSHYEAGGVTIDTLHEHIDEDDGISEFWQIKSTLDEPGKQRSKVAGSWVETGLRGMANFKNRSVDQIKVQREGTPPRQLADYVLSRENDPKRRLRFPSSRKDMHPSGDKANHAWATPPRAYISQVDAWVIPALLPADEEKTYAFFAYHPESTAVGLRIMRVEPKPGGGKFVHLRPTIDLAEQTLEFDANNRLVRWSFHDGRVMQRTTREEFNRIWKNR